MRRASSFLRRRFGLAISIVVACAAAVFLVVRPGVDEDADAPASAEARATEPDASATLLGPRHGASPIPLGLRGRGAVVGHVLRAGVPRACSVTLHVVRRWADADPLGVCREGTFVDRFYTGRLADSPPVASVLADEAGRFGFEGLKIGVYEVRARARGGSTVRSPAEIPTPGARVETILRLPGGEEGLRGRVVYGDGRPFRGFVTAQASRREYGYRQIAAGTLMASVQPDGSFAFPALRLGGYRINALQPGRMRYSLGVVELPQAEDALFTIVLPLTVRGRVVDADTSRPVPGAQLIHGSDVGYGRAVTDDEGRFAIPACPGEVFLSLDARDYVPISHRFPEPPGEEIELRLLRAGVVFGSVSARETGEKVPGTWVFAIPHVHPELRRSGDPVAARTDASGRFELRGVTPGANSLIVFGAGWCSPALVQGDRDAPRLLDRDVPSGERLPLDLEAVPSARLEGRVLSAAGNPVVGALVHVCGNLPCTGSTAFLEDVADSAPQTVSAADGRFTVETVLPHLDRPLHVEADGHAAWKGSTGLLSSGETGKVEVRFTAPRYLDVTVRADPGAGIPAAQVMVVSPKTRNWSFRPNWVCDENGQVRVGPLPPGRIDLRVEAHAYLATSRRIGTRNATGNETVVITLERGHSLAGRVRFPEGVPARATWLSVRQDRPNQSPVWELVSVPPTGVWRVDSLPPGRYEITLDFEWKGRTYRGYAEAETGEEAVDVVVETRDPPQREIVVRVQDADGHPVGSGMVFLHPPEGWNFEGTKLTGGRAALSLHQEVEDTYCIEVWDVQGGRLGATMLGPFEEVVDALDVCLEPSHSIEGKVLGASGLPVVGQQVQARLIASGCGPGHVHARTVTDDQGRFHLRGLGDFTYQVQVIRSDDYVPIEPQIARAGVTDLAFTLADATGVEITVLDPDGKPVKDAQVHAFAPGILNPRREATADARGVATLRGLDPSVRYTLWVGPSFPFTELARVILEPWTPQDMTVRLKPMLTISGRVVDLEGQPVERAYVVYRTGSRGGPEGSSVRCDEQGRFVVRRLQHQPYRLIAAPGHRYSMPGSPVEVDAGASDVELRVDRGVSLTVRVDGWPDRKRMKATLCLEEEGASPLGEVKRYGSGPLHFAGLEADRTYALRVEPEDPKLDRCAFARGLRPGGETIPLQARVGGTITGSLLFPGLPGNGHVKADIAGFNFWAQAAESGAFTLRLLPDGVFLLEAHGWDSDNKHLVGSINAATGDRVVIPLAPE